ncbi:GtrA family protein [Rathayibacter sp. YIM 133350]|uniref:GtrA family protein n=1 Tax=Rathayibacter sp. YIM 133350 TaxID=3131992 RepID=UPI00307F93E0
MKKLISNEKIRFLIAGCANTALDFILLNVLTLAFSAPVLLANVFSVSVGICVSYLLNHFFVFRYEEPISLRRFGIFFGVTGFSSLIIQNVVIYLFELLFGTAFGRSLLFLPGEDGKQFLAINIAKACAVLLGLVWNFIMYKLVVFRGSRNQQSSTDIETAAEAISVRAPRTPVND